MRIFFLFLFAIFGIALAVPPSDTIVTNANGLRGFAGIWNPQKISRTTPITIWFHGGMTSGRCNKGLEAGNGYFELAKNHIVVSPSACMSNHWLDGEVLKSVDLLLDSLEKTLKRKIEKINLVGVSDGCIGVVGYSFFGRRTVEKRLLISGNLTILGNAPADMAKVPQAHVGDWTFLQGGNDRLYPLYVTEPWIDSFCAEGKVKCIKHVDPNGEHDWGYWVENRKSWILETIK